MATSYYPCLSDERLTSNGGNYASLEPCEVLTEEEWILGGLTPWVDSVDEGEINVIHVDGTQDDEAILEASKLEEPLHFKPRLRGLSLVKMSKITQMCWRIGIETKTSQVMCWKGIGGTWT